MSKLEIKKNLILAGGFLAGRYVWANFVVKRNGKGFVEVNPNSIGMDDFVEALTIAGSQVLIAKLV